ncbi:MAG: hypothetical protein EBX37_16435, partial [Alphaproteobacteria bacterium]|nr:hypothetical protein [Alphaproteobacteria bacterium]
MSNLPRHEYDPTASGALADVRVVDLSRLVAGNVLTKVLADHGAEVIKIEPLEGDTLRAWKVGGVETSWKTLNLRNPAAIEAVLALCETAAIFVESFRPGVLEAMGLSPETLLARNPALVIVRITVYMLRHAFPSGSWVRKSERAIAWTVWVLMVLHITAVLPGIRLWLDEVRLPLGKHDISLLNVIEGTLSVGATMVAAVWLGRTVEQRLMAFSPMDVSLRVVFSKLLRAIFIILG